MNPSHRSGESATQHDLDAHRAFDAERSRHIPAWLLSLMLHTIVLVILMVVVRSIPSGAGDTENRTGGIVLVNASAESTEYLTEGDVTAEVASSSAQQNPPPLAASLDLPPELPGFAASETPITGVGDQFAEALPGAESLIDGTSQSLEIGGKVTTEVFGVKGTGSRFVYVFDRSKSMEGYQSRPLLAARQALLKSLSSLEKNHQFQIIFYNDEVRIFSPSGVRGLYFATDDNKRLARNFVESIRGDRGTDHLRALKEAFRMGPDVVFLLTDAEGGFTSDELAEISESNRSGAVINAIEFGERRGDERSLERLAIQNGGQYVFKNIRTLQIDRPE